MRKIIVVVLGVFVSLSVLTAQSEDFKTAKSLEIQYNILRALRGAYVEDSLALSGMVMTGVNAILAELDPYTVYIPEEDAVDIDLMTTGSYGGVGAMIQKAEGEPIMITQPYASSAAQKFGLQPGDKILEIDGESVNPLTVSQASTKMRGRPGSVFDMRVLKARGGDTVDIKFERGIINFADIQYHGYLNDTTVYFSYDGFTDGGAKEFRNIFSNYKQEGSMKRLVLDLRSNGGGLMSEAIELLSVFLPKNTMVVSSMGRDSLSLVKYYTESTPVDIDIPITVLVDSQSASSSEIVAGALQDLERATIVGERTFGKGLVQAIRDVGYGSTLKLTTARYYTPSGRCVQGIDYFSKDKDVENGSDDNQEENNEGNEGNNGGIEPDVKVEPKAYSRVMASLVLGGTLQDYAIKFFAENLSIAPAADFELSERQYEDFVEYVCSTDFDSRTESEIMVQELIEAAKRDGIYDSVKDEFTHLESKVSVDASTFLYENREEISPMLENEIVSKYYYAWGQIENFLDHDIVLKAIL